MLKLVRISNQLTAIEDERVLVEIIRIGAATMPVQALKSSIIRVGK